MTPETAIAALLTWFEAQLAASFKTFGRRLKYTMQVTEQPALFLVHEDDDDIWSGESFDKTIVGLRLWIMAKTGPDDVPDTVLNALVAAVAGALQPDDGNTGQFTLGGKVSWCRIEGKSEFYPGDATDQALVIVPIKILLTA